MSSFQLLLDNIGYNGPIIMTITNLVFLWKQKVYFLGYIFFEIINYYVNIFIKNIVKQPRPAGYKDKDDGGHYDGSQKYGMPSGHTQSVVYSITYSWLVGHSMYVLIGELFIVLLTLYQRWKYKKHSVEQLLVGAIVGACVANVGYYLIHKNMRFISAKVDI